METEENDPDQLKRLEDLIKAIPAQVWGVDRAAAVGSVSSGDGPASQFHAEIEVACAHREKHHPQLAIAKFNEIRDRFWDQLSQREKYRVLANRGLSHQDRDDFKSAATDFIECRQYQPEDEKARLFEASGYFMRGDDPKSHRLAQGILADFPNCTSAYALLVRSAPDGTAFDDLEAVVPLEQCDDGDVAYALSVRALRGRLLEQAESYARAFLKADPALAMAKANLGSVLVNCTIIRIAPLLSASPPVDAARLEEAIDLLIDAAKDFATQGANESRGRCHHHLGRAYDFLGRDEDAEQEFRLACDASPGDVSYTVQLVMMIHEAHPTRAIQLLKEVVESDDTLSVSTMLGQMTRKHLGDDNLQEAIQPLEDARSRFPGPNPTSNSEFLDTLAGFYQLQGRHGDALSLVKVEGPKLGNVERLTLRSAVRRRMGDVSRARNLVKRALKSITEDTAAWHKHIVVRELMEQGLNHKAFALLTSYVPDNCISLDTRNLIACAQLIERDDFLIEFLSSLRQAGVFDASYVDLELGLLERYHAGEKSIAVAQELMASSLCDDEFRREMRVRLSFLGMNYDRPDLIITALDALPEAAVTRPYVGFLVVQLLLRQGLREEARDYAYTLVRANFKSPWPHKAMIGAYLFNPGSEEYVRPEVVKAGSAFRYRIDATGEVRGAVLEDGPKPDASRDEFAPDHHIFADAIGKKAEELTSLKFLYQWL